MIVCLKRKLKRHLIRICPHNVAPSGYSIVDKNRCDAANRLCRDDLLAASRRTNTMRSPPN